MNWPPMSCAEVVHEWNQFPREARCFGSKSTGSELLSSSGTRLTD